MIGQIIKIVSDIHYVKENEEVYPCKCRGVFRHQKLTPLVGDKVEFSKEKLVINNILPRQNEFERPRVANINQAFLVTSVKEPDFSLNLLDKLLILMELHHVESIICITKVDLLSKFEKKDLENILDYYKKIGYKVVYNNEIKKILSLISSKTSVFTGQTGAGKSTLLNHLNPSWNLETGEVSSALGRGRHTTRVTELFSINHGEVLDTPGFSALDFKEYSSRQIENAFPEFQLISCPFQDCTHTKERECKIKEAVASGKILKSRYELYLKLIERRIH